MDARVACCEGVQDDEVGGGARADFLPGEPARVGSECFASACPCCRLDLDHLPRAACFCPRCGQALAQCPAGPPPVFSPNFSAPPDDGEAMPGLSAITRGYAQALFKLGRRYETATGSRHNPGEAMRCYSKAARLGSNLALDRLTPRGEPGGPV